MMKKPDLLSVVTNSDGDTVYLHADLSGLRELRSSINRLINALEKGECEHDHFRSEDWAGYELTTSMLETEKQKGYKQVHHIKLYAWTDEWKVKHNL